MAYTPGVARVCNEIAADPDKAFQYTIKKNTVAVVSDGTAVLGLGDIGPEAAMPVMEGKAMLFKEFADVDAFPICLDTKDPDEIVQTVKLIAPTFGGINLEDISSPRCFEIENQLVEELDIPVFHDDQHGTAIVVLAALLQRVPPHEPRPRRPERLDGRRGRRRRRGGASPDGRRRRVDRRLRPVRVDPRGPRRLRVGRDERAQDVARREHEPGPPRDARSAARSRERTSSSGCPGPA